jgi:hypothetical protein
MSLEVLIPILYLKGISTGQFEEALLALLGEDAGGLSTIARLKDAWSKEHARWSKRDLSIKRYVYFWVDGIHDQARWHWRRRSARATAVAERRHLLEVLASDGKVTTHLDAGALERLFDPMAYQGASQALIDRLLASLDDPWALENLKCP